MTDPQVRYEPVSRRTLSEEVRDALIESIRSGEAMSGSRMPSERELCEQFGVARTSVREAIQGLVTLGLLERRGNRTFVAEVLPEVSFDGEDRRKERIRELFEVRQVVEIPIARLATCRASEEQRQRIVAIAATFNDGMRLDAFRRLDREFHWEIARAAGNATLLEVYGKVLESLFRSPEFEEVLSARANRAAVREVIRASARAHKLIAKAISDGDWAEAIAAAERHLDQVEDQMISRMA